MRVVFVALRQNVIVQMYRHYFVESVLIVKRSGLRELVRRRGWKFVVAIAAYYLVRDTIMYVILPYCITQKVF